MAAYLLAPQYSGSFVAGAGADAEFYRIENTWRGSAVPTDGTRLGTGTGTVGSYSWGTGLWGQVDWLAVQQAAAGLPSAASDAIVQRLEAMLPGISHGNARYNECYGASLGVVGLAPFFTESAPLGDGCIDAEAGDPAQHNWTARYTGFIRITNPGYYNFGVLSDDGFFFRLIGANEELGIGRDFLNPPDRRIGFAQALQLDVGLYGFELGAWNRLGAGVVDLRWASSDCAPPAQCDWTLLPTENLVSMSQVPEPPALLLVFAGLLCLMKTRARQRSPQGSHSWCPLPIA